jgi:hypothetical protein
MSDEQNKKPRGDNRGVRKMLPGEEPMEPTTVPAVLDPDLDERLEDMERVFSHIHNLKKRKWLAAIAVCGRMREAAEMAKVDRRFHYMWRDKDPEYMAEFERARSIACDAAEDEIFRRGIAGIDHTKFQRPLNRRRDQTILRPVGDLLDEGKSSGEVPGRRARCDSSERAAGYQHRFCP